MGKQCHTSLSFPVSSMNGWHTIRQSDSIAVLLKMYAWQPPAGVGPARQLARQQCCLAQRPMLRQPHATQLPLGSRQHTACDHAATPVLITADAAGGYQSTMPIYPNWQPDLGPCCWETNTPVNVHSQGRRPPAPSLSLLLGATCQTLPPLPCCAHIHAT